MSKSSARVLFVSHSASRNGATILLLHLLRWLRRRTDFQIEVLVAGKGDLLPEFQALVPTRVWRNPARVLNSLPQKTRALLSSRLESAFLKTLLRGKRYDLVHLNTVANWRHVPHLTRHSPSLLWHVHEMSYAVRLTMGDAWEQVFPMAQRFVAVSQAVHNTLVNEFKVLPESVDLVHGFIPPNTFTTDEKQRYRTRIRKELGFAENAFVVGGCGALGWRKGTDLFVQIAKRFAQQQPGQPLGFLWVGGHLNDQESLEFQQDVRLSGIHVPCRLVATTAAVAEYYCAMDAFALTSREDPFPLVMLEAGAAGLPTVCFEQAGGGSEFVRDGAGFTVPYLNLEAFCERLEALQNDVTLRRQLGDEAARRVHEIYTVEHQAPLLLKSMERCLKPIV